MLSVEEKRRERAPDGACSEFKDLQDWEVAKMPYSETDEPDATHPGSRVWFPIHREP